MPLHRIDPLASSEEAKGGDAEIAAPATYASDLSHQPLARRRMPEKSVAPAVAYALVHDELLLDGNSRQNLATFCTTWVSPEVRQLMSDCIDKDVPADGRDRGLRGAHPRRSLALACCCDDHRVLDHGVE